MMADILRCPTSMSDKLQFVAGLTDTRRQGKITDDTGRQTKVCRTLETNNEEQDAGFDIHRFHLRCRARVLWADWIIPARRFGPGPDGHLRDPQRANCNSDGAGD